MQRSQLHREVEPLTYEDFEKIRCSKCGKYLNCPPIMAYLRRDNYAECGRCFNSEVADEEGLRPIRNHSLELLASITPFPCKNYKNGCMERRTWPQIETHELECLYRTFVCPLSVLETCVYSGGMQQLVDHFNEKHQSLLLIDGSINQTFDKDFECYYLVQQNSNLFVFQVKYDVHMDKAWFVVNLLEERNPSEFNLEFSNEDTTSSFIMKHTPFCKPVTIVSPDEALEIDLKAVKMLLKEPKIIKCRIYLNIRFASLSSSELLKEIQCPACWDYMKGKIFICKNGHNICGNCKEFVTCCPTCRDAVLNVRNLSLEKVISCALFPCKNHTVGCVYVATLEETIYHYRNCALTSSE